MGSFVNVVGGGDNHIDRLEGLPQVVLGAHEQIVRANGAAARLLGYGQGELTGRNWYSLHKREPPKVFFPRGRELCLVRGDGGTVVVDPVVLPCFDSHCLLLLYDLTNVVRERDDLLPRATCIPQFVSISKGGILHVGDIDGLLGYEPGEYPRDFDGWFSLIHPNDRDRIEEQASAVIEQGGGAWDFSYWIRAKDGSYRFFTDRGAVTKHVDGKADEGVGHFLDRTGEVVASRSVKVLPTRVTPDKRPAEMFVDDVVATSATMREALELAGKVAPTDATALVVGETGTGKELVARAIHANSQRKGQPLLTIDCTALPASLIEAELFGYEKGAFTGAGAGRPGLFEQAHGGTVFLDEIGELPKELQPKLLRVLQDGEIRRVGSHETREVDVRVIAATNRDLELEVEDGNFRSDLFYRLSVFPVRLPPLRARPEDISLLAQHFAKLGAGPLGSHVDRIPDDTMRALVAHPWPGNVRELKNVIERALILSPGRDLVLEEGLLMSDAQPNPTSEPGLDSQIQDIQRREIEAVLAACDGKIKGVGNAAERLCLSPSTLRSRMKRLGIER